MLQLVYISTARGRPEIAAILAASQRNNDRAGVTGLLYSDGVRFLQVLEGDEAAVLATFDRIERDERHRAIVVLSRRAIEAREFGRWAMAHRAPGREGTAMVDQIAPLLAGAAPSIRATFQSFAGLRRAA